MSILDTRNAPPRSPGFSCRPTNRAPTGCWRSAAVRTARWSLAGEYPTGGAGLGAAHLGSQGSVILTADGRFLLVTNAGSDDSRCSPSTTD